MKFLAVASTFVAAGLAAPTAQSTGAPDPSRYENIDIADYTLRKNDGIQAVYFKLSGNNGTDIVCSTGAIPSLPSQVFLCGETKYRFGMIEDPSGGTEPGLAIYHETGLAAGKWGTGSVPTYCHAGGNGQNDFVCQQVGFVTIVIQ